MAAIFDEYKLYTLDPYWKTVFDNCAAGKYPQGMAFSQADKTVMIYSGGKRICNVQLPEDNIEAFKILIDLFRKKLGLSSPTETKEKTMAIMASTISRPRQERENMLFQFIKDQKTENRLCKKEKDQLISVLNIGLQLKQINFNTMTVKDGRILEVPHLIFDEKKRWYWIDAVIPTQKVSRTKKKDQLTKQVESYFTMRSKRLII